jgi:hypothetical protein
MANRTQIANIVNAIFAMAKNDDIKNLATPKEFEFGLFAQQDIKALMSALYSKRIELVKLQYVADKPLFDGQPQDGSLEANDSGVPDEYAEERAVEIKQVAFELAIIERRIKSLEMQAAEESEEAGNKTQDGGRIRFNLKTRQFKPYMDSFEDYLIKAKAEAKPNTAWLAKIEKCQETIVLPHVTAQDAIDQFKDMTDDSFVTKVSDKAWERMLERFEEAGQELTRHDFVMAQFNNLSDADRKDQMPLIAEENKEFKYNMKQHSWWIDNVFLEPIALLAHEGAPKHIINSPEWRTHEARIKAAEAQANAQEAMAATAEAEAMILQCNANMALFTARQMQIQMEQKLAQQQAMMNAMFTPPAAPAPVEPPAAEAPSVEPKPAIRGRAPRTLTGRGAAGFAPVGRA